ncbi:hypothetical protein GCM10011376_23470 [Nocardioides flavus (ex Wang et al. 2016)]|uniref:Secreted protein n=1 Tax=Nocardioides flavus (ex Wang et al. 2016) TaxID=2058780 RepID=A0ABQ3HM68_9ACTN|nr:hypothetical protein GCM10011376_23470 [Nocardioides flavus (ex Wang et al. 2016)]
MVASVTETAEVVSATLLLVVPALVLESLAAVLPQPARTAAATVAAKARRSLGSRMEWDLSGMVSCVVDAAVAAGEDDAAQPTCWRGGMTL